MGQQYAVTYRKVQTDAKGKQTRYNVRIGTAFVSDGDKHYINIRLNALPLPQFWLDGQLVMFPEEPRRGQQNWREWDEEFPR